jgi:signal transduction histidine kinase
MRTSRSTSQWSRLVAPGVATRHVIRDVAVGTLAVALLVAGCLYALGAVALKDVTLVMANVIEATRAMGSMLAVLVASSKRLAQVITNLLNNAAQHAPGSSVRISALQESGHVVVRVRDFGRVPAGQGAAVFERGVRDRWSRGSGLGLHISRDLLAGDGGTISIGPSTPDYSGCTVVMRVPGPATPGANQTPLSSVSSAAS